MQLLDGPALGPCLLEQAEQEGLEGALVLAQPQLLLLHRAAVQLLRGGALGFPPRLPLLLLLLVALGSLVRGGGFPHPGPQGEGSRVSHLPGPHLASLLPLGCRAPGARPRPLAALQTRKGDQCCSRHAARRAGRQPRTLAGLTIRSSTSAGTSSGSASRARISASFTCQTCPLAPPGPSASLDSVRSARKTRSMLRESGCLTAGLFFSPAVRVGGVGMGRSGAGAGCRANTPSAHAPSAGAGAPSGSGGLVAR